MKDPIEEENAIQALNGKEIGGRKVKVNLANPKKEKEEE